MLYVSISENMKIASLFLLMVMFFLSQARYMSPAKDAEVNDIGMLVAAVGRLLGLGGGTDVLRISRHGANVWQPGDEVGGVDAE